MQFRKQLAAIAVSSMVVSSAWATNGMNVEGYGPIATGMGGASMAYDNGNAAMMNNPATLGLADDGSRLDLAVGFLGPDVKVVGGLESGGDAYIMPAGGYTRKNGNLTYGFGIYAQGGMGTEYAMGVDGLPERSELGIGRMLVPLAYNVNDQLTIAGSVDFVLAMLDLKMAMPAAQMGGLLTDPGNGTLAGGIGGFTNARLEFSDGSDFTGKAMATGFAGKIGLTYKINDMATIGATFHTKTSLSDMETDAGEALMIGDGNTAAAIPGKITVRDFQWPAMFGVGVSVTPTDDWMFAADIKRIKWEDVMEDFTMTYSALGDSVTFALPQMWEDQTVVNFGAAYKASDKLTLRAGLNIANNPIPDATLHYLFPAIVEDHYTVGFGYDISDSSAVNFSLQYAPEVTQTSGSGFTVDHSQTSWQLMYSAHF
jgi:long-chain fatty acid transport protein